MSKLLIILAIVALLVWWYRRHRLPPQPSEPARDGHETTMVRCDACQLFLPPSHATRHGGRWYCEKHRRDT